MAQRYLSNEQLEKIKQLNQLAEERGQTLAQMAIAWILRRPEVTTVLVGASRVSQLDNSLAALECTGFSENELKKIDEILGLGILMVTTPTEPVLSPEPKNPPLFLRSSRRSRRRRQHMLLMSLGFISLLI